MAEVRAFVFDAYGTLFDVHSVVTACREVTPDPEALSREWRAKQLEYTWLRSLMGHYQDFWQVTEAALRFAVKHLKIAATERQVERLMAAYLNLGAFPEVSATLQQLHPIYPLAILSNGSPHMLQAAVQGTGLGSYIRHVISVDTVQTYKPSPLVYELAPKMLGVGKEAIVFVSTNSFDVIGAKAFGFQVIWCNRANAPLDELSFFPDATVTGLDQIPGAIRL